MPKVPLKEVMAWIVPLSHKTESRAYSLRYFIWWNEDVLLKYGIMWEDYLEALENLGLIKLENETVLVLPKAYNEAENLLDGYIVIGGDIMDERTLRDLIVERTLFILSLEPFGRWTLDIKETVIEIPLEELHKVQPTHSACSCG